MATIAGRTYSSPKNINLKQGILRFDVSKTSNPLSLDSKGWGLYVNSSNELCYWNKTGVSVIGASGGGSTPTWETIFAADSTFTITPDATFTIAGNRATATDVLTITNAAGGSGDCLQITNSGSGNDIAGTGGLFSVAKTGIISARGLTLSAASTITTTAGDITWTLEDNDATALTIGASGATSMLNFVTTNGSEAVVFGNNITLTDGLFTATSTSNTAPLFLLQNDTVTTYGADNAEDTGVFVFSSDTLTTGDLIRLQLDESALNGGAFLKCVQTDAGTAMFTVAENGVTTIAGAGGSNALVVTAGDVVFSDASLAITDADNAASFTVTNNTATSASVVVLAGSGVFTGSTTSSFMTITPSGMTTGTGIYAPMAALTTGKGVELITNALTTGQALLVSSSNTTITGAGRLLSVVHSGNAGVSAVLNEFSTAAADETNLLKLTATAALAAGVVLDISASAMTTGTALDIGGMAALTTGNGIVVAASGTTQTTGILLSLSSAGTAITGAGRLLYSNHTGITGTSAILNEFASAAGDETVIAKITASGALALGKALHISTASMTTGTALYIDATEATLTTGKYIECYDGAANDFSVAKYGATVIAGNAGGTAALTVSAGDLVITDTDASTITSVNGTATALTVSNTSGVIGADAAVVKITANGDGSNADSAVLRVHQDHTGGVSNVIHLVQDDISQPFIGFESTIGEGNAIEAVGAKTLTTTHFIKVDVEGVGSLYMPAGTIA